MLQWRRARTRLNGGAIIASIDNPIRRLSPELVLGERSEERGWRCGDLLMQLRLRYPNGKGLPIGRIQAQSLLRMRRIGFTVSVAVVVGQGWREGVESRGRRHRTGMHLECRQHVWYGRAKRMLNWTGRDWTKPMERRLAGLQSLRACRSTHGRRRG